MKSAYETFSKIVTYKSWKDRFQSVDNRNGTYSIVNKLTNEISDTVPKRKVYKFIKQYKCAHAPAIMESSNGSEDVYCANCEMFLGEDYNV